MGRGSFAVNHEQGNKNHEGLVVSVRGVRKKGNDPAFQRHVVPDAARQQTGPEEVKIGLSQGRDGART